MSVFFPHVLYLRHIYSYYEVPPEIQTKQSKLATFRHITIEHEVLPSLDPQKNKRSKPAHHLLLSVGRWGSNVALGSTPTTTCRNTQKNPCCCQQTISGPDTCHPALATKIIHPRTRVEETFPNVSKVPTSHQKYHAQTIVADHGHFKTDKHTKQHRNSKMSEIPPKSLLRDQVDWRCGCGHLNPDCDNVCNGCGKR